MDVAPLTIRRSVDLDVDARVAWRLVGSEEGLAAWLGAEVEAEVVAGGALHLRDDDGAVRSGTIEAVDPGRSLTFTWSPRPDGPGEGGAPSTVTLAVDALGEGRARVTVVESLPTSGGSVLARMDAGAAWDHRLLHLELGALARSPVAAPPLALA